MSRHFGLPLLFLLLTAHLSAYAQSSSSDEGGKGKKWWGVTLEFDYLFDNREYDTSPVGGSYTLNGVWGKPAAYLNVDDKGNQRLYFGINLLKEFGSSQLINHSSITAYYQLKSQGWEVRAGLFPNSVVTCHLSDRLIDQRNRFERPVMGGLQVSHRGEQHFVNAWIDWISKQGEVDRERFQAGLTSRYSSPHHLFASLQLRMMHLATSYQADPLSTVVDDLQGEFLLGYAKGERRWHYSLALGSYATVERDRAVEQTHYNVGLVTTYLLSWHDRLWIDGYIYYGMGHQQLREKYSTLLYFEHPFLQSRFYTQAVGHWQILSYRNCSMQLELGLHLLRHSLSSHQALTLTVTLP